jgi:hypothetical protein
MFLDELNKIEIGLGVGRRGVNGRLLAGFAQMAQDEYNELKWRRPHLDTATQDYMTMSDMARTTARARMKRR